jgi:hypothetical protein
LDKARKNEFAVMARQRVAKRQQQLVFADARSDRFLEGRSWQLRR